MYARSSTSKLFERSSVAVVRYSADVAAAFKSNLQALLHAIAITSCAYDYRHLHRRMHRFLKAWEKQPVIQADGD
jgi:hypothetical protein